MCVFKENEDIRERESEGERARDRGGESERQRERERETERERERERLTSIDMNLGVPQPKMASLLPNPPNVTWYAAQQKTAGEAGHKESTD